MTILTLPARPGFQRSTFGLVSPTQTFRSPLSGRTQTLELPGAMWRASLTLPPMPRQLAATWCAWLVSLSGQAGRFYCGDPDAVRPQGRALGAPVVLTGSQTGKRLLTAGWTPNQADLLRTGDYVAWDAGGGRQMVMLTAPCWSDVDGRAWLDFAPPIRTSPADGAALLLRPATCIMMLAESAVDWDVDNAATFGITFSAIEAF